MDLTMLANNKTQLFQQIQAALDHLAPQHANTVFVLERPKNPQHGDYACNLALQLARPLQKNPRQIAEEIVAYFKSNELIEKIDIAGAGFINFTLTHSARQNILPHILEKQEDFGRSDIGQQQRILIEFVSANPTGPLHVGHGRGAAYGASLSNILAYAGFSVAKEYYINDAGRQMDILALSTWLRYLALCAEELPFPVNAYQGEYVKDMAKMLHAQYGQRFLRSKDEVMADLPSIEIDPEAHIDQLIHNAKHLLEKDYTLIHQFALDTQLADVKEDLAEFGVTFDQWFSEQSLHNGSVAETLETLAKSGYLYEKDGATWFRSTGFEDEKDRVVERENGIYTYFASDIAYIKNKFSRGFKRLICIFGADHHGYIPRMVGAAKALGFDSSLLDFPLVQFAILYRQGQKVSMSTRGGEFVTLRELRNEVGNDAARFFYILRKSDQHLDFDLDLAKSKNNENPVYYIQYAHARICRILEETGNPTVTKSHDFTDLTLENEAQLLQKLADFPETIVLSAQDYAPHLIAFYLKELAAEFHSYYNSTRILVDDPRLMSARLGLITAIKQVLANGLALLGVSAPVKM